MTLTTSPLTSFLDGFAEQVAARGDALAVADGEQTLTFEQLDRASNRIAHAILPRVGDAQEVVAVLLGDTADALVALLGITKAGQIRLALDSRAPAERIGEILAHAGARLVVTNRTHEPLLAASGEIERLVLETLPEDLPESDPGVRLDGDALYALIYTSGSTGSPKAVALGHREAVAAGVSVQESLDAGPGDRIGVIAGLGFTAARLFDRALLRGASSHLVDLQAPDPSRILGWLAAERITYVVMMSSTLRALLDALPGGENLPDLRILLVAGEPLFRTDVEHIRARVGRGCVLAYGYGAAELGGITTLLLVDSGTDLRSESLSAGAPIAGTEVELEDVGGDGVGEIVVRSIYVARGYWRDPELSAERFASDPNDPTRRSFKTRDLGRFRSDGTLEVLGRRDDRVKIRGYSVDPSEVERVLASLPGVAKAAVRPTEEGREGPRLVGYIVPDGVPPTATALRRRLLEKLPPYMVPARFVRLESLPVTATGKVDRRALPPPPATRPELDEEYAAPRDELERTLVRLWEKVLGVRPIGIDDNFYALGGDSLAAAEAKIAIGDALRQELPLMLFAEETATVAALAQTLRSRDDAPFRPVVPLQPEGQAPPFFCVHGAGGEILELSALAPLLAPDFPFYGLQLVGVGADRAVRDVPGLARHFLDLIRAERPDGPYVVGGYSSGGAVAFELATQLAAAGTPPAAVVLLDALAPTILSELAAMSLLDRPAEKRWKKRLLRAVLALHVVGRRPIPPRWLRTHRVSANIRALRVYEPGHYGGELILLRTDRGFAEKHRRAWEELADRVRVFDLPGGHHSMLMPPHVDAVAEVLRSVLPRSADERTVSDAA